MENTNIPGGLPQQSGGLPGNFSKKWLIAGGAGILLVLLIAVFFLSQRQQGGLTNNNQSAPKPTSNFQSTGPEPTLAPDVQKAANEAQQASEDFDSQQAEVRQEYPWIRKMPVQDEKYFVYFDLDSNTFFGHLYLSPGDDAEQVKTSALKQLRSKGVPIEKFQFDWSSPQ